jgi:hypothetical protein
MFNKMLEKMKVELIDEDPSRDLNTPDQGPQFSYVATRIGFEIKRAALKPTAQQQS